MSRKIFVVVLLFNMIFCSFSGCLSVSSNHKYITVAKSIKLDEFKNLNLDVDIANVNIYKSDQFKIEYKLYASSKDYQPLCKVENDILIFKHRNKKNINNNNNDSNVYVNIYIKDKIKLDDCKVKISVGDFKLYEDILFGNNLEINTSVGNIEVLDCLLNNAEISTNVGDIKIKGDIAGKVELKTSVGDVKANLLKQLSCYNYELSTNVGEIDIDDKEFESTKSFVGAYLKNNVISDSQIKVFVNTGDIIIKKK